jgi:SAM-dependent methyltransferase
VTADTSHLSVSSYATPLRQPVPRGLASSVQVDLFVASFLALFMEVMLIRWVPTYERVLAYFTNFILIAAFLGLGLGAMLSGRARRWLAWQPLFVLGFVSIGIMFSEFGMTGPVQDDVYYVEYNRHVLWFLSLPESLALLFFLVAVVFVPMGQQIGKGLKAVSPPLTGYVINILGSLAGVLAFTVVSFLELGPWWWFGVAMLGLLWFVRRDRAWLALNTLIGVVTVFVIWFAGEMYFWTPYHALAVYPLEWKENGDVATRPEMVRAKELPALRHTLGFHVRLSGDFYQQPTDLSPRAVQMYSGSNMTDFAAHFELPFSIPDFPYNNILVIGAGTGNDVAAALRHGVRRVDAVEIDPGILRLGQVAHPEQPYSDPRVHVFVDDARSFINKTDSKYDLIIFGSVDAHRLFSGMSSVRLDSFLYTVECFQEVRRLLKQDGIVVVQHTLGNMFLNRRMYHVLTEAFGKGPYVKDPDPPKLPTFFCGPGVGKFINRDQPADVLKINLATDDWPFFYLRGRFVPPEYRVALEAMLLISLICLLSVSEGGLRTVDGHFFFLGAAFLLIETVSVTRFAMLFGSTWMVNSIVFSAILLVVLLANLWMNRIQSFNIHLLYVVLAAAVLLNFMFPVHVLLSTGLALRLPAAMILMALPIFFAAFIFARSYKQTPNPDLAFASNLLGAVIGGLIEYSSMVIGFRNLFLVALGLYALSYFALFLSPRRAAIVGA